MYLISPKKKQYKANLHCHSICSDGNLTPQQLKDAYKAQGYSVLAITDHEVPKAHPELNDPEFIAITAYEAYIRSRFLSPGKADSYCKQIHLNLFARDPENEAMVCYNSDYCKYLTEEQKEKLKKVGSQAPRQYSPEYINAFLRTAKENGYLAVYNHPVWSLENEQDVMAYEGFTGMEICNYSSFLINGQEYNAALYDRLLSRGKRLFCHSADDNHNKHPFGDAQCDSFGGFTMLMPEKFTYDGIIRAMETGEMYSSMGPVFHEVSMEANRIHIECSPVAEIRVFTGSNSPKRAFAQPGQTITSADFEVGDRAKYVRVSIADSSRKCADTRGYFRDELEF